jgi:hypothetical protein
MKRALMVAAAAMVAKLSGPAGAAEATDEIKQNCAAEWPGDYAMQQYCYDRHVESLVELKGLVGSEPYPKHVEEISARCLAEWPGEAVGYNRPMVAYCTRRQLEAYEAVQR